jgi:threonine/homoserine/homoserine lactone efflux protein
MESIHPMLLAGLTGFVCGLVLSIPVGPVNLLIMNEGARRGFQWAMMIGVGATLMELIYCLIAFTGFASFFNHGLVKEVMELTSFVFMLVFGLKFLLAKTVEAPLHLHARADAFEHQIEERLHPHSALMTGFVRVLANPGVLVGWTFFAANFISREWVTPDWPGKLSCVGGVAVSIGGWFTGLSWVSSLGQHRLSPRGLLRMERISGLIVLCVAVAQGVHILWRVMHHKF